jgi:exonuclease SbcC
VIPIFETEINNLLAPLVDFTINVEIDDKYISFKIVYGDVEWPLELTSGMEKFIASIALRHALMKISNRPQPNFLFIDEGWGKLDSNNLSQLYVLFNYLKGQYDLIWIVSHIDGMKDVIDQLLSISKLNGFSHVDNRN